jgi:hypothetical protein
MPILVSRSFMDLARLLLLLLLLLGLGLDVGDTPVVLGVL